MSDPLIWLDLETTGLDPTKDLILEVGLVATDDRLQRFEGVGDFTTIIYPEHGLDVTLLPAAVVEMHSKNGLLAQLVKGEMMERVSESIGNWLRLVRNVYFNTLPPHVVGEQNLSYSDVKLLMAGSTVGQFDRQFFQRAWPEAMEFFNYRCLDVSTVKEIVRRLYGDEATYSEADAAADGVEHKAHRVLPDIEASIAELRFYINTYFKEASPA